METREKVEGQQPDIEGCHSMYEFTAQILEFGDQQRPDTFSAFLSPQHRTLDTIPDPSGLVYLNLTRCHI